MEEKIAMILAVTWCVILTGTALYALIEYFFLKNENK
tara:strand:- start:72 stop:182 length:111 start_codon:yes stop_codon:yes gene_type:complete